MEPTLRPRVKICCIGSREEASLAIRYGASALGLVSAMPSGPGVISEDLIADIVSTIPPGVASVLLTSKQDTEAIIDQQRRTRVTTLQLVDAVPTEAYGFLRRSLPDRSGSGPAGIRLIQVIHVTGEHSIDEALAVAPFVDAILLDSGNPKLAVKELGGTGRTHDWGISRRIREAIDIPLFLAGGLTPENVDIAIAQVGPYAVDVCSGVRTDSRLDEAKLSRFIGRCTVGS